ncbi:MAG: hypothetical protein JWR26_3560 [Pedosphaera sp.]|nr:hypothetical protein [Pedosphaera sp.]
MPGVDALGHISERRIELCQKYVVRRDAFLFSHVFKPLMLWGIDLIV